MKLKTANMRVWKTVAGIVLCVLTILFGILYFYRIHLAFIPNGEDLDTVWRYFVNGKYDGGNVLWNFVTKISYQISGLSYNSVHLQFTILNAIVLILTLLLSIRGKDKKMNYFILPLFAFFMIFLHTVKEDDLFAVLWTETDMIYMLPYDYHSMPRIFGLLGMLMVYWCILAKSTKHRIVALVCTVVVVVYGALYTDMIYYVVFLAPLFIILFLHGFRDEKWKKICFYILVVGFGLFFLTRLLPFDFTERLWTDTKAEVYGGAIYGASNFVGMNHLEDNIINYVDVILQIFNINLPEHPLLSLWSVVYLIKLFILLAGYYLMFRIIISSIKGTTQEEGYDLIDEMAAWGYAMLSIVFIFSEIGKYSSNMRYVTQFLPLVTIVLCRNIKMAIPQFIQEFLSDVKYKKALLFVVVGMICICYAEPVWFYHASDSFKEDLEAIVDYVEETDLGYAIAPHWLCSRLTIMSGGEVIFYPTEKAVKKRFGEDAKITYMVTTYDYDSIPNKFNNLADVESYDKLCEKYGTPTELLELEQISLCVFEN